MPSEGSNAARPAATRSDAEYAERRAERTTEAGNTLPVGRRRMFRRLVGLRFFRLTGWRRYAGVLVPLALAASVIFVSPAAEAVPAPTVSQVKQKVKKLREQADQAAEDYVETREKLKSTKVKLKAAKKEYKQQTARVKVLKEQVGLLAAETYRRGELSTLELILSDDPEAALSQAGYLPSLSQRQGTALKSLTNAQKALVDSQKSMKQQLKTITKSQAKMKKAKEKAETKLAAAEAELDTLEASQRAAANVYPNSGAASTDPAGDCAAGAAAAPSTAAATAINYACSQLGDAYVWAATGPDYWDCSGLTMQAYAAAGISLPHSSRLQAGYGTSVSVSSLQAGDLVFFHSPISHVGIYLGNGMMVHAPSTGDVVKVASMYTTPVAAVRLG